MRSPGEVQRERSDQKEKAGEGAEARRLGQPAQQRSVMP